MDLISPQTYQFKLLAISASYILATEFELIASRINIYPVHDSDASKQTV